MKICALGLFAIHLFYAFMHDCARCLPSVLPILPFGIFQAVFVIAQLSLVPLIVSQHELLPLAFALLKVAEGVSLLAFSYLNGWVITHFSFPILSMLLCSCALLGFSALSLIHDPALKSAYTEASQKEQEIEEEREMDVRERDEDEHPLKFI